MTTSILDLDTQQNQFFYDSGYSGYSGTPSPGSSISSGMLGSPMSQGSDLANETSHLTMNGPQILYDLDNRQVNAFTINAFDGTGKIPNNGVELVIIEEPVEKFRFRYKSEMHGTHGSLMGCRTEKSKKTYPTVELRGYNGKAVIVCSLYQTDSLTPMPHSHRLVVRNGDVDLCDPHELTVSPEEGYRAVFQGMGIIHTAKKHIVDELKAKMKRDRIMETGGSLTPRDEMQIKANAERIAKNMNLNQVCLGFQAFAVNNDHTLTRLCKSIFSRPINNMKSALTGELKITRLSAAVSSAAGGDDLFLFVEKVGKKNIKVRFFEIDDNDEEVWEGWGVFSEADVHHQYAIALRTPPYKDKDIDHHKEVFIQLVRPSDNDRSEPMPFKYKPRDIVTSRKRARMSSSTYSSSELPETVVANFNHAQTISTEYNTQVILDEFLNQVRTDYDSGELASALNNDALMDDQFLVTDGTSKSVRSVKHIQQRPSVVVSRASVSAQRKLAPSPYICQIFKICREFGEKNVEVAKQKILDIFDEANNNECDVIQMAIRTDDSKNMIQLLKLIDKFQLNEVLQYQNERKETCLHIVCLFDKPEYIRPLINLGANPNLPDNKGNTPLHIAIEENMTMCANRIIDPQNYTQRSVRLIIDCANDDGLTPLHLAVMKSNQQMVERLLKVGKASTKLCVSKSGNNALHLAIERNCVPIVRYLLENTSINVNEPNLAGFTPLRLANSMDNVSDEIVRLLLKWGANEGDARISHSQIKRNERSRGTNRMETEENTSSDDEDDDDEKPLTIDEKYESDEKGQSDESDSSQSSSVISKNYTLYNKENILELAKILNKDDKWRKLAVQLKLDCYLNFWGSQANPTLYMFQYLNNLEKDRKTKLKDVIVALHSIKDLDTIKFIHKMEDKNVLS
ncbi:unnamed protein product [Hermetia illucens]|uniref:RHD domain-containing protein n=1 Tax=Hermetia illucens TaxID=343691 RepID=A0A7R8V480_HERIL|nr:unnamed protein product [Hermetia illucens]